MCDSNKFPVDTDSVVQEPHVEHHCVTGREAREKEGCRHGMENI
jgi:hypothetical protein